MSELRRIEGSARGRSPDIATGSVGLDQQNEYANNGIAGECLGFGGWRGRRLGADGPEGADGSDADGSDADGSDADGAQTEPVTPTLFTGSSSTHPRWRPTMPR
jgi:hypothetical protein